MSDHPQPDDGAALEPDVCEALLLARDVAAADGRDRVSVEDLIRALGAAAPAEHARITPYPNGPYLVRGRFVIDDPDGLGIDRARRTVALCRCGKSKVRPFCDGTHKLVGFTAPSRPEGRA